ncbi:hypothetical protein DMUE_2810 [Dictyocoela muelleri]|nr:hypothetical protein DMUE_2810 [Dictyocoela muelleri]
MIFLIIIKISCASNFEDKSKKHDNNDENIININFEINLNSPYNDFNQKIVKTSIGNNKLNMTMIPNTNALCFQNFGLSKLSSNFKNNEDKIYASENNFQTKIHAVPPTNTYTEHNENPISFSEEFPSDQHNSYKSINQTSLNENISSNNHLYFESQNNHNSNQAFRDDEFYQSNSKDKIDEKYSETSKYPHGEEILSEENFDHSDQNIFLCDEIGTTEDLLEIQRNADFEEIFKLIERDQELIKEENEKSSQDIIPLKRPRMDSSDLNVNISNPLNQSNDMITQQPEVINIKSNISTSIEAPKTNHEMKTTNLKKVANTNLNDKISNHEDQVYHEYQLKYRHILPRTTKQTNNFSNIPSTSKTFFSIEKYRTIITRSDEIDSPYDNDFDSPNFSLDFLNSYIADLNKNYLEKCENIFSVVDEKIKEELFRLNSENNFYYLAKFKTSLRYKYYLIINSIIKIILKEILDEELPIYICSNSFINLNYANLDIFKTKNTEYNIFRINEQENDALNSLINNIENKYKSESKRMAKSAYKNFLKKSYSFILCLKKITNSDQINNEKHLYSNINKIIFSINNSINFTNDQITETDSLIIYKVLKSISKFLKRTSEDQYLTSIFPELRIINILYYSKIKDHHIYNRKFHAGILLKKILKTKLKAFKVKYQSVRNIDHLDNTYFKEILETRTYYIFNFFKFLNIKKPYLMAYYLLSIKSYLLKSQKVNYKEKNEFERIFSLNVLNLDKILNRQVIIHIKPHIKWIETKI